MNKNEPFTPESVDEQIDQFSTAGSSNEPRARVVQGLRALYAEQQRLAEHVWERLAWQVNAFDNDTQVRDVFSDVSRERIDPMSQTSPVSTVSEQMTASLPKVTQPPVPRWSRSRKMVQRLTSIVASLAALLLVSSLLWALHLAPSVPTTKGSGASIYVNALDGLSRLDIQTNKIIWHTPIAGRSVLDIDQAPVVINDTVYIYYGGHLLAFRAATGAILWNHTFQGDIPTAPYLEDGLLVVLTEAPNIPVTIREIDPVSGISKATLQLFSTGWQSVALSNHTLYYTDGKVLYAVQLPGKEPLWHRQVIKNAYQNPPQALGHLSVAQGVVYVTTMSIANAPHYLFAFDARTGENIWQSPAINSGFEQITIFNNSIYASTDQGNSTPADGNLYAFNVHSHTPLWQKHFDSFTFWPTAAGLYVVRHSNTAGGHEDLIALNMSTGEQIWQRSYNFPRISILGTRSDELYVVGWNIQNNVSKSVLYALKPDDGTLLWQVPIGNWSVALV